MLDDSPLDYVINGFFLSRIIHLLAARSSQLSTNFSETRVSARFNCTLILRKIIKLPYQINEHAMTILPHKNLFNLNLSVALNHKLSPLILSLVATLINPNCYPGIEKFSF